VVVLEVFYFVFEFFEVCFEVFVSLFEFVEFAVMCFLDFAECVVDAFGEVVCFVTGVVGLAGVLCRFLFCIWMIDGDRIVVLAFLSLFLFHFIDPIVHFVEVDYTGIVHLFEIIHCLVSAHQPYLMVMVKGIHFCILAIWRYGRSGSSRVLGRRCPRRDRGRHRMLGFFVPCRDSRLCSSDVQGG